MERRERSTARPVCPGVLWGLLVLVSSPQALPQESTGFSIWNLFSRRAPTQATHEQVSTIAVPMGDQPVAIHTFCVASDGNLLAACGGERVVYSHGPGGQMKTQTVTEPSGIRVISPEGKLLCTWSLDITPQAINVGPDGSIYVGGQGKIARLDREGRTLVVAAAPQMSELPPLPPIPDEEKPVDEDRDEREARQARIQKLQKRVIPLQNLLQEAFRTQEESKGAKEANAEAIAKFEKIMAEYQEVSQELQALTTSPRELAMRQRASAMRKRGVSGFAVTDRDVFVACPAAKGYGFEVWRLDRELTHPKRIVKRLSGCCGQMDIQAWDGKLYAAENGRHRVVCYDRDGQELCVWGKRDRRGVEGFGSCCNPMNLRFGPDGNLYTSEATLGRIKRYSPTGKFLGLVGTARVVPGCTHVAIGLSKDGHRVYLLDITRNQIAVMERRDRPRVEGTGRKRRFMRF